MFVPLLLANPLYQLAFCAHSKRPWAAAGFQKYIVATCVLYIISIAICFPFKLYVAPCIAIFSCESGCDITIFAMLN